MAINNGIYLQEIKDTHSMRATPTTMGARRDRFRCLFLRSGDKSRSEEPDRTKETKTTERRGEKEAPKFLMARPFSYVCAWIGIDLKQETNRQAAEKNSKASAA
jgi:hypothetical protein